MRTPELAPGSSLYSKSRAKFAYSAFVQRALSLLAVISPRRPFCCHTPGSTSNWSSIFLPRS